MRPLKQMLREWVRGIVAETVPTKPSTVIDTRHEPPVMIQNMDASRVMSVMISAENGYTRDLFALYRDIVVADSHLQAEFNKRKLAVLGDTLTFLPFDKTQKADIETAAAIRSEIDNIKGWITACGHLLDATLYPVSVLEKVFRPVPSGYSVRALVAVPHHMLDYSSGHMQIFDVDQTTGQVLSTKHDADPARYIVHRGHLLTAPDNWGGPMRSIIFWWLLSAMSREWWGKFLERYGTPFLVGKFERGDEKSQSILERAFAVATRLGGLVITKETEVEIKQAAAADSGQAYAAFIGICQKEKSKLVLGQSLSSEAQPTGLGSGTANMQEGVRQDIRAFDAKSLSATLRDQLVVQLCQINSLDGRPPRLLWGFESSDDINSVFATLGNLEKAGLELTDQGVASFSERSGLDVRRKTTVPAPVPFSVRPQGIQVSDSLATLGANDLARSLRRQHADIARILKASRSQDEALHRLMEYFPELSTPEGVSTIQAAIQAAAVNGAVLWSTPRSK